MGVCQYCGQKVGWFSDAHAECVQKADQGIAAVKNCVIDALVNGKSYEEIRAQLGKL